MTSRSTFSVRIQQADFDLSQEIATLRAGNPKVGAVVSFVGTVRDMNDGLDVATMELEHYPGMTEKAIEAILAQAGARWPVAGALVIHRVGPLKPQEQIVLVAVSAAHRGEAFAACEFIIDYLKTEAPFWKKEDTPAGARWVDARVSDEAALSKWSKKAN
ncbi:MULTISPECIES: molybdenum cofactor biosynthesis protein MoaE [unclassified Janthinobacterium]|uniref:molybdenum cofactor biosynthesis protein MoaE n=1 Tax=unclassified Janthinobacterium TaxID=2610881 RepID=UPI00161384A7|nr:MULTISPECIES: molybdenum cofactor biosynthesis protein MoaE [unclassified Janthinobacterium]MBB5610314.1 molybdopterin synthase catalytic subunit [Janthinobacterium sp. S3T4]MBB5615668.1 molybdopterin synthase catalytic subunit [Janthinobacterium sp. S3M3]